MDNEVRAAAREGAEDARARSKAYDGLLRQYIVNYRSHTRSQKIMKWVFYVVVVALLVAMVSVCVSAAGKIWDKPELGLGDIAVMLGLILGAVAAFVTLPRVVAENLFSKPEDDRTAEIVCALIEHDAELRALAAGKPAQGGQPAPRERM